MSGDAPAVVARALRRGWMTSRIVATYPVSGTHVRQWRWRMQLVSTDAQRRAVRNGIPLEAIERQLGQGVPLMRAAAAVGATWDPVKRWHWQGAFLYPPLRLGYPRPDWWATAARRYAIEQRRRLALEMMSAGLPVAEAAEIVGRTPRHLRNWRQEASL